MDEFTHIYKYHLALLRTLNKITGKEITGDSEFERTTDYSYRWHSVGALAIAVWEFEAFHPDRFEEHPEWDAAAGATFQYLVDHCSRCGARQPGLNEVVLCTGCRQAVTDEYFAAVMDGPVAQEVAAFAEDLAAGLAEDPIGVDSDAVN